MTNWILNNECLAYLTLFIAGTFAIIFLPIFLAKFIMKQMRFLKNILLTRLTWFLLIKYK